MFNYDSTTLLSPPLGSPPATAGTENKTLFAQTLVDTAEASLATLRLIMTITFATIVNRGYCFLNVF